jgi:hypothetical protein
MDDLDRGTSLGLSRGVMPPVVLILEARKEVASALEAAIALADLTPIVIPHLERLSDVPYEPAAIVVRIAFESVTDPPHEAIARLPRDRPPVVAKCDVVLHAPHEINRLCETLTKLVAT